MSMVPAKKLVYTSIVPIALTNTLIRFVLALRTSIVESLSAIEIS